MKKIFSMLFVFTMLSMVFVACDDEKDEPISPKSQKLESVYENETDTHFLFDIDLDKDSSSIYFYNVVFTIGEVDSPPLNIRIDAPVTVDKSGKVFTYAGTDIIPFLLRGNTPVPAPSFLVTNLACTVDTNVKSYSMSFDCHGGHYSKSGKLK